MGKLANKFSGGAFIIALIYALTILYLHLSYSNRIHGSFDVDPTIIFSIPGTFIAYAIIKPFGDPSGNNLYPYLAFIINSAIIYILFAALLKFILERINKQND